MFMRPSDAKKYPRLTRFLRDRIPVFPVREPKKFDAFMMAASGPADMRTVASMVLVWGFPSPQVKVTDIHRRIGRHAYGHTPRSNLYEIWLDAGMARSFEKHPEHPKGKQLVEVKTLHELVHFLRKWLSMWYPQKVYPEPSNAELGAGFEVAAFGRVIQMRDEEWGQ